MSDKYMLSERQAVRKPCESQGIRRRIGARRGATFGNEFGRISAAADPTWALPIRLNAIPPRLPINEDRWQRKWQDAGREPPSESQPLFPWAVCAPQFQHGQE